MLAIVTTLLLASAPDGTPMPPPLGSQIEEKQSGAQSPEAKAQAVKDQKWADLLHTTESAIAQIELTLTQVSRPKATLMLSDSLCLTVNRALRRERDEGRNAKMADLGRRLLDMRAAALAAGGKPEKANEARWVELAKLVGPKAAQSSPPAARSIDVEIERNARLGNSSFVIQLGKRAVPGLLAALEDRADHFPKATRDPLYMLMKIDPLAADAYLGRHKVTDGHNVFWDLGFANALSAAMPFHSEAAWPSGKTANGETTLVHTLAHCDRLLSEPQLETQLGRALVPVARRGQCTDAMLSAMMRHVDRDEDLPIGVLAWARPLSTHPRVRPVLLRAMQSDNAELVNRATNALRYSPTNEGLYATILAGPQELRMNGVNWLASRMVNPEPGVEVSWRVDYGPTEADFVDALLRDTDWKIRMRTLEMLEQVDLGRSRYSLGSWPEFGIPEDSVESAVPPIPLRDETLRALTTDESTGVRFELAYHASSLLTGPQMLEAIGTFRSDPDEKVRERALKSLKALDWAARPNECIALVNEMTNSDSAFDRLKILQTDDKILALLRSQGGLEAAARWAIDRDHADLTHFVTSNNGNWLPQLQALPTPLWTGLVAHILELKPSKNVSFSQNSKLAFAHLRTDQASRSAAIHLAATRKGLSALTLYGLVSGEAVPENDELAVAIVAMLGAKEWHPSLGTDSGPLASDMKKVLAQYTPAFRERIADQLVADAGMAPEKVSRCFRGIENLPITSNVVAYAKARTKDLQHPGSLVITVLKHMSVQTENVDIEWIKEISREPYFAKSGLEAVGKIRDESFLSLLSEIIEGPVNSPSFEPAVLALLPFLTDEVAPLLLLAARKTGSETLGAACIRQVEKITALQEAEARLATRQLSQSTREATVSKLMVLLTEEDDSIRIEAIRGLGTWEAVEAMPELIGLLKDTNKEVSAAARATLALLNGRN